MFQTDIMSYLTIRHVVCNNLGNMTHEIFDNEKEANQIMQLAIGRILLLGSRPFKEGDIEDYENARHVFLEASDFIGLKKPTNGHNSQPGWNFGNSKLD